MDGPAGELKADETAAEDDFEKPRPWLVALKVKAGQKERPQNKAFGRWLGDFLDRDTPNGLLKTELLLLDSCMSGMPCRPAAKPRLAVAEPAGNLATSGDDNRQAEVLQSEEARLDAVKDNLVRADFLRFLVLDGDDFAPVHEEGINLHNALVFGSLNLGGGKCVNKVALSNCFVWGRLNLEGASLGVLVLTGTWLQGSGDADRWAGIEGNRVKVSGTVFLDSNFVSKGIVTFFSAQIGGSLDCTSASIFGTFICARAKIGANLICENGNFTKGIEAQGAAIAGDARFSSLSSKRAISLAGAEIGGSFRCAGATLRKDQDDKAYKAATMLDLSRATIKGNLSLNLVEQKPFIGEGAVAFASAKIGGNLYFWSASITIAQTAQADVILLDGQNVKVGGSIFFGGGFETNGRVSLYGAEIARDLDFSGSIFRNAPGWAIVADMAKVSGSLKFQTSVEKDICYPFRVFGGVSLVGVQCAEMNCEGGRFNYPGGFALDGTSMNVAGSVILGTSGKMRFEAVGAVSFNSARIGQNLSCSGGKLENLDSALGPKAVALECGAVKISGSVSLINAGGTPLQATGMINFNTSEVGQHFDLRGATLQNPAGTALDCQGGKIAGAVFLGVNPDDPAGLPFSADGKVSFIGATVGLQFICQSGEFRNASKSQLDNAYADYALELSSIRIADAIFLGAGKQKAELTDPTSYPPTIKGSVNLGGATVRVLIDDGFVTLSEDIEGKRGLWRNVTGQDGTLRRCILNLNQFTYERMAGDDACDSQLRAAWLERQPPEDLSAEFKPQPFEQLVTVMRAMGYDDDADEIARSKRVRERQAARTRNAGQVKGSWTAFWDALLVAKLGGVATAVWGLLVNFLEYVFLQWFIGYGYRMSRAVIFLFVFAGCFAVFYTIAFRQGAIEPADKDVRDAASQPATLLEVIPPSNKVSFKLVAAPECKIWSVKKCPGIADQAIPLFNPLLYSVDVMVPAVSFGEKAAWAPDPDVAIKLPIVGQLEAPSNFVYDVQLVETVLGWVEGFLLVSFVTGLIAKE